MDRALSAPVLERTLDLLLARERRRRRSAALRRTFAATAFAAFVVAGWRIFDRVMGREPLPVAWAAALVALVVLAGLVSVVLAAASRSDGEMAREVDRRLGLDDRASSALALVRRPRESRLAAFVIDDVERTLAAAGPRVDAEFPARPETSTSAWTRALTRAALVVVALAVLAELLGGIGLIPVLPGISFGGGGRTPTETPAATQRESDSTTGQREDPSTPPTPSAKLDTRRPPSPQGAVHVAMKTSKEEFEGDEPILATVSSTATGELAGSRHFDLRVSVDGVDVDSGVRMRVDPSRPEGDRAEIDLLRVPGLKIEPGEHVARARLTTRTTHEEHASAPVKFRVRAPSDKQDKKNDGGGTKPKPDPKKSAAPQPKAGDPSKKESPPNSATSPPAPPAALNRKVVVPLFGEGEEVKKRGLVLVLDPGGGIETPPTRRPLGDALPDAKRRAEQAVDRAGVREEDRDLVRRYFEGLEALRR